MRAVWRPTLLLLGLLAAGIVVRALPEGGVSAWLQLQVDPSDARSVAVFVLTSAVFCAVGVPRQVVAYSAGYAFGATDGFLLALVAQIVGCAVDFVWARAIARDWAQATMRRRLAGRVARLERSLMANPFTATLMLRLMPVGNNLVLNLLAGALGIAAVPFLAASSVGYVPQTMIFALLGAGVRLDHSLQVAVALALFAGSALAGVILFRRLRAESPIADG